MNRRMVKNVIKQEFQKEKYDRCIFNVPKGYKVVIEAHWKASGYKSLNSYVNALIEADMKRVAQNNKQDLSCTKD